jgi:hypothetical protein
MTDHGWSTEPPQLAHGAGRTWLALRHKDASAKEVSTEAQGDARFTRRDYLEQEREAPAQAIRARRLFLY